MKKNTSKSQAQQRLAMKIEEAYPMASVRQERYIGDLVKEAGFSMDEIAKELGHKPHKMFVDIIVYDSDGMMAFEYHGEQHYRLVGNMTKTNAALMLNQQLDREKEWILDRIGVPLIAIPFDMYVDTEVLHDLAEKAILALAEKMPDLIPCSRCQRKFPEHDLRQGECPRCAERRRNEEREERERLQRKRYEESASPYGRNEAEMKEALKERRRQARREARERWKNSEEYEKMKEERKRQRRELYEKRKKALKESNDVSKM